MPFPASHWSSLLLVGLPLILALELPTKAQDNCPYATLRIDSVQYVDQSAVCEAAKPWANSGYEVLIFLTDARPIDEDGWFVLLDRVEAEAGLRDLTQADSFEKAAIALEATTATDLPFAISITYGEALYNTPLDTNEAALEGIKRSIRNKIATQDATWGLTTGLEELSALAGIPTAGEGEIANSAPRNLGSSGIGKETVTPTGNAGGKIVAGGCLALAGGGTVGVLAMRRRRRKQLKAHLETLQNRIANLLMWCEQLLTGGVPEHTLPYQLFAESDGERYPDLMQAVKTHLAEARQALDQAFQAHAHLRENSDQLKLPLMKRVEAWEMLYLAFVGKHDRIRNMSDEELRTLLNPALILSKSSTHLSQGLISQLEAIQGKIKETPLKVELKQAESEGIDNHGILGRIEQVDATIDRLQSAVTAAPEALASIRKRRPNLDGLLPYSLQLSAAEAFGGIDCQIAVAEITLTRDRLYLQVLEECQTIEQTMDWIATLNKTFERYDSQQAEIQALVSAGYRPPDLQNHQSATHQVLGQLRQQLRDGKYASIPEVLSKLEEASLQTQKTATSWRDHHIRNQDALQALTTESDRLVSLSHHEVTPAWQTLQQYPASNWTDLTSTLDEANQVLQQAREEAFPHLYQQNDFPVQALAEVSEEIEILKSVLERAERQLQAILERHQLVQSAQTNLTRELAEVETCTQQITQLVNPKILGIFAVGKPDMRLQDSQALIETARHRAQDQEYLRACEARDQALRLVLFVYLEKIRDDVAKVRSLVMNSDSRGQGQTDWDKANTLMADDSDIRKAKGQTLFAYYSNASQARLCLATAESLARQAIRRTKAARSRASSSSYSSSSSSSRSSSRSSSSRSSSSRGSSSRSSSSRGSSRRR